MIYYDLTDRLEYALTNINISILVNIYIYFGDYGRKWCHFVFKIFVILKQIIEESL